MSLFGDEAAPQFDQAFDALAGSGFDAFFPLFVLTENPESSTYSAHGNYFLSPRLTGSPDEGTCRGVANPYEAAEGRLDIWFPGLLLLGLQDLTNPIDEIALGESLRTQAEDCWPNHPNVVSTFYGFDEPVMHRIVAEYLGEPALRLENVQAVADVVRESWGLPLMTVEGPGGLSLRIVGLPEAEADEVVESFWDDSGVVASANELYGFNLYPVPDFSLLLPGEYVRHARGLAPHARVVSVMQGMALGRISLGVTEGRAPTQEEVRFMAVDSVAAGADVLAWYGASSLVLSNPEDAALWSDVTTVVGELATVRDAVTGTAVDAAAPDDVWVRAHAHDDAVVVFVSHRSDQAATKRVRVSAPMSETETIAGTAPTLDGAELVFDFGAYGSSIVRVR